MVAAITKHDADFIEWEMPLAKGRQFQAIWIDLREREDQRHGFEPHFTRAVDMTPRSRVSALAG